MIDDQYDATVAELDAESAAVETAGLMKRLVGWYREDMKTVGPWRKEAREDNDFYAGDQWSDEEVMELRGKRRPVIAFNRVAPLVNAIVGAEINNRREVQFIPRQPGKALPNEMLTGAADWFRDQSGAEDEDSVAFQDAVICGLGVTETRLDFSENPDGDPVIARIDPFEMVWDSRNPKANMADARRVFRVRNLGYDEARELFPDVPKSRLHAGWASATEADTKPHNQDAADRYEGLDSDDAGGAEAMCTVVECQWVESVPFYRAVDPVTGEEFEMDAARYEQMAAIMPGMQAVRSSRRVTKRAFLGADVLSVDEPMTPGGFFTYQFITGYWSRKHRHWYGIVRAVKDPQRWANKWLSQVMHILNSQSKGGITIEDGAVEDIRQFEESWAKADAVTKVKKGALSEGRIQPKPAPQLPVGFMQLMQESRTAISEVTGLSPEFLGTREANQPGVLEYQRRQSSLNLLAGLFDSLRRYRKRQGRLLLHLIQNFLADGRLVRIAGNDKAEYVPLMREDVTAYQFDIIVDDAPSSPNEKEKTWQIIQTLFPLLQEDMTPDLKLEVLRYSPLPASLVEKLAAAQQEAMARQQEQAAPEQEMAMQQAALMMEQAAAKTEQARADADFKAARAEEIRIGNAADMMAMQYGVRA